MRKRVSNLPYTPSRHIEMFSFFVYRIIRSTYYNIDIVFVKRFFLLLFFVAWLIAMIAWCLFMRSCDQGVPEGWGGIRQFANTDVGRE